MPQTKPYRGARINKFHPQARGLVAYYPMNGGIGNKIIDLVIPGESGTFGTFVAGYPTWGRVMQGLAVDCSVDRSPTISLSHLTSFADDVPWTIFWNMHLDTFDAAYQAVCCDSTSDARIFFRSDQFLFYNANSQSASFANPTFGTGTRNMGAIVCDGTDADNLSLYINGSFFNTQTLANTSWAFDTLCSLKVGGYALQGSIVDFGVVDNALSASEISQLHREPYGFIEQGIPLEALMHIAAAGGLSIPVAMLQHNHFNGGLNG